MPKSRKEGKHFMRSIVNVNSDWIFTKKKVENLAKLPEGEKISLPHSWNAIDGQDGGNDYFRGTGYYAKAFSKESLPAADEYYLEIRGANSSADVYLNGKRLAHHDGGYSTWRVELTEHLAADNVLFITVDNSPNEEVYPQMADFTFYGGLYRDVNIICVNKNHFDLDFFGGEGVTVTPTVKGEDAELEIKHWHTAEGASVRYRVYNAEGEEIINHDSTYSVVNLKIEGVHLWNGRRDPYLYTLKATLVKDGVCCDEVTVRFGCRTFKIDPDRGFILNGEE